MSLDAAPADFHEWRRLRAWALHQKGWERGVIAEALDVSEESVRKWVGRARREGEDILKARPRQGAPPKLSEEQKAELVDIIELGAEEAGFEGERWTQARIRQVIIDRFEVTYHQNTISRLLDELGYSYQKPATRAAKRDDEAIMEWRRTTLAAVKKRPQSPE